jgi:hypothetical protein
MTLGIARVNAVRRDCGPTTLLDVEQSELADIYVDLRTRALHWRDEKPGVGVRGLVTDIAYDEGLVTIACLSDESTSMFTNRGGGILGAGDYEEVAAANRLLLKLTSQLAIELPIAADESLPTPGHVRFSILTTNGLRSKIVPEDELADSRHNLAPVYGAVQAVVYEMGRIDDAAPTEDA